jgi:hypothetical protein
MPAPDPKILLQAHALRTRLTRQALLYGRGSSRTRHGGVRALLVGVVLAAVILVAILLVVRIKAAL